MESIKSILSTLYSYSPFPIYPTDHPYVDFIMSFTSLFFFFNEYDIFLHDKSNYKLNVSTATTDLRDLDEHGFNVIASMLMILTTNLVDVLVKGVRVVITLGNDINDFISLVQEQIRIFDENKIRLEEEKLRSFHGFLEFIQNRLETIEQEEIFLEKMRKEKIELIHKQKKIEKEMIYYCFGNDPDLNKH